MVSDNIMSMVKGKSMIVMAVLLVLALVLMFYVVPSVLFGFGFADEDEYRVETEWGATTGEVYEEGLFFVGTDDGLTPLPQGISYGTDSIPATLQTTTIEVEGESADGQTITAPISVSYQIDSAEDALQFRSSGESAPFDSFEEWEENVGEPAITSAVTDAVSQTSALELLDDADVSTNESEVDVSVETIREDIDKEAERQINEENSELSPEVSIKAVRVLPIELSQQLDNGLEQIAVAAAEAEQEIERAEGEAEAVRIEAEAQQDAAQMIIEAWSGEEAALEAEWIEAIDENENAIIVDADASPLINVDE